MVEMVKLFHLHASDLPFKGRILMAPDNKKPHTKPLTMATYRSSTDKSKKYNIVRGMDGTIYCTCFSWKIKKTCKHLEDYQKRCEVLRKESRKKTGVSVDLKEAINKAVERLGGR